MTLSPLAATSAASPFAALAAATGAPATAAAKDSAASSDRFLKLLVTQLKNQDPLNPTDNAQVTSQMAQLSTVSGIEKLNATVASLASQFTQSQALQGVQLVGRGVVVPGDRLAIADGVAQAGFELAGPADGVNVEVLSAAGKVIDTLPLGALQSGLHSFHWPAGAATDASGLRFRVVAKSGTADVASTALMRDKVDAVATGGDGLTLELQKSGSVAYSKVKAFN